MSIKPSSIKHRTQNILSRSSLPGRKRGRMLRRFGEKFGFVYFGSVDQHRDDHQVIRGLTISPTHTDDHYSVGSFDGYDVSIVDRTDVTTSANGIQTRHNWLICEIKLQKSVDTPHFFLGSHNHTNSAYSSLFTSFSHLQPVPLGALHEYGDEFTSRYGLFAAPTHFIDAERIITGEVARSLAAHFWPLAAEVYEGSVYVYADNQTISEHLLETMVTSGVWLAHTIDVS